MARRSLPPGFRFHPTNVELVLYYLKRKVMGKKLLFEAISELNIYKFSPWDLPDKSCLKSKDLEWYYFCPRERKYASGARMNRATETGYWKTTGKDRPVIYSNNIVGMVKTLVFHQGNAPHGQRTDWVIHEYRIEDKNLAETGVALDAYVLCKVFHKNGLGPKNGAQYGAPFKEEDWNDDEEEVPVDSSLPDGPSPVVLALPEYEKSATAAMSMVDLGNAPGSSLNEPGPSFVGRSNDEVLLDGQHSSMVMSMVEPANSSVWSLSKAGLSSAGHSAHNMILDSPNDNIVHLLAAFSEDGPLLHTENENNKLGDLDHERGNGAIPHSDESDLFNGLEDLSNWDGVNASGHNFLDTRYVGCPVNNMLPQDMAFLELDDLDAPLNFSAEFRGTEQMQTGGLSRPCNSSGNEQMLNGSLCTEDNSNSDLRQLWYGGNFPGYNPCLTDLSQIFVLPYSSYTQGNSTNVFQTGDVYDSTSAAHNLDFASYGQQEELRNAAGKMERGGCDHISTNAPDPIRTPKLSVLGRE